MSNSRSIVKIAIWEAMSEILKDNGISNCKEPNETDLVFSTGLDSLGFAVLVTQLEETLGYDPFTLMDDPFYPSTYGEFVAVYEKFYPK